MAHRRIEYVASGDIVSTSSWPSNLGTYAKEDEPKISCSRGEHMPFHVSFAVCVLHSSDYPFLHDAIVSPFHDGFVRNTHVWSFNVTHTLSPLLVRWTKVKHLRGKEVFFQPLFNIRYWNFVLSKRYSDRSEGLPASCGASGVRRFFSFQVTLRQASLWSTVIDCQWSIRDCWTWSGFKGRRCASDQIYRLYLWQVAQYRSVLYVVYELCVTCAEHDNLQ